MSMLYIYKTGEHKYTATFKEKPKYQLIDTATSLKEAERKLCHLQKMDKYNSKG